MTSRELTSGFDFWSRGHLRMAVMHLPVKFGAAIFIQCGVIDIFLKLKMAAAAILDLLGKPWDHPRRHTSVARVAGPLVWNSIADCLRDPALELASFKRQLKTFLFARY